MEKSVYQVRSEGLVRRVKEIVRDARVKRVIVKDSTGKILLTIPVTWGAAGAIATLALAPWLVALGVIASVAAKCTVEVERVGLKPSSGKAVKKKPRNPKIRLA